MTDIDEEALPRGSVSNFGGKLFKVPRMLGVWNESLRIWVERFGVPFSLDA